MITADQLVAHAVGDYIIQSDWMATEKTKQSLAAGVHAVTYALPFLLLTRSPWALAIVVVTHFVIDRWRLARFVCWAKNLPWPGARRGRNASRPDTRQTARRGSRCGCSSSWTTRCTRSATGLR